MFEDVTFEADRDYILYVGPIDRKGYTSLSNLLEEKKPEGKSVTFILSTYGGDPDAGYRIARAVGHHYPQGVSVFIPDVCKSAGTLIALGSSELIISDRGELGPLDVQFAKKEELFEVSSGLDILKSVQVLKEEVGAAFRDYLFDLRLGGGIGTKLATRLASEMASNLVAPISSQIDPIRLGEHQRALLIALAYGKRLCGKFKNITPEKIDELTMGYPSHGFVIDRKESAGLFENVRAPTENESMLELSLRSNNVFSRAGEANALIACLNESDDRGDGDEEDKNTAGNTETEGGNLARLPKTGDES